MTTPESYTLDRVNERLERLTLAVDEIVEADARQAASSGANAEIIDALVATATMDKVQTRNINALLGIVVLLARDIDELRQRGTS